MTPPAPPSGTTPAPATERTAERPLTVADRTPQNGDVLLWVDGTTFYARGASHKRVTVAWMSLMGWQRGTVEMSEACLMRYHSRADNGPVTVPAS